MHFSFSYADTWGIILVSDVFIPGMDGITCPSSIPFGLMLFDIWIHIDVLADLIQNNMDTFVIVLVLLHTHLNRLNIMVIK